MLGRRGRKASSAASTMVYGGKFVSGVHAPRMSARDLDRSSDFEGTGGMAAFEEGEEGDGNGGGRGDGKAPMGEARKRRSRSSDSDRSGSGISVSEAGADTGDMTFREKCYEFFENPTSSRPANAFGILIMVLILVSSVTLTIETLPALRESFKTGWFVIETVCVIVFTFEYLARFFAARERKKFLVTFLNILDLLAILPYYIELVVGSAADSEDAEGTLSNFRVVRTIRLVRVFRIFKLSRYSRGLRMTGAAISKSMDALTLLVFYMGIGLVLFSSAVYYAERGVLDPETGQYLRDDGLESPFVSIPHSFWWCISTLTTVGYGDVVPITAFGRIVGGITMMAGIMIIALPTSILGTNFMRQYQKLQQSDEREKRARAREASAATHDPAARLAQMKSANEEMRDVLRQIARLTGGTHGAADDMVSGLTARAVAERRVEELESDLSMAQRYVVELETELRRVGGLLDLHGIPLGGLAAELAHEPAAAFHARHENALALPATQTSSGGDDGGERGRAESGTRSRRSGVARARQSGGRPAWVIGGGTSAVATMMAAGSVPLVVVDGRQGGAGSGSASGGDGSHSTAVNDDAHPRGSAPSSSSASSSSSPPARQEGRGRSPNEVLDHRRKAAARSERGASRGGVASPRSLPPLKLSR